VRLKLCSSARPPNRGISLELAHVQGCYKVELIFDLEHLDDALECNMLNGMASAKFSTQLGEIVRANKLASARLFYFTNKQDTCHANFAITLKVYIPKLLSRQTDQFNFYINKWAIYLCRIQDSS